MAWSDYKGLVKKQGGAMVTGGPAEAIDTSLANLADVLDRISKGISNIAALKALTPKDKDLAIVTGQYSDNDGGGGMYVYSQSSARTADDLIIVAPNSGVGRWVRLLKNGQRWVGYFTPTVVGIHQLSLTSTTADFSQISNADCTDLRAIQDGAEIPLYVSAGDKANSTATVFVRALNTHPITLVGGKLGAGLMTSSSRLPTNVPAGINLTALSCSHSLAGASNPVTSFVHPSVAYIAGGFAGHAYWLAVTPFDCTGAAASDDWEDPCIFYSDDGSTWTPVNVNASGYANIDAVTNVLTEVHSDPCLVYDSTANKLYCYYRHATSTGEQIYRQETSNGTTWSNKTQLAGVTSGGTTSIETISPSVVYRGAGNWVMWTTRITSLSTTNKTDVRRYVSTDGVTWTGGDIVPRFYPETSYLGPWHIDVKWDATNNRYIAIFPMARLGTSEASQGSHLFLAYSDDGIAWTMDPSPLMGGGAEPTAWGTRVYRSCLYPLGGTSWGVGISAATSAGNPNFRCTFGTLTASWAARDLNPITATFCGGDDFAATASSPTWKTASGTVTFGSGTVTVARDAGAAGQIVIGDIPGGQCRIVARVKLVNTNSKFGIGMGAGISGGILWNYTAGKVQAHSSRDPSPADLAADTNWHTFEVVRNDLTFTIYRDGTQVHTTTLSGAGLPTVNTGSMGIWASGSVAGDGVQVDYLYWYSTALPTPMVSRAV